MGTGTWISSTTTTGGGRGADTRGELLQEMLRDRLRTADRLDTGDDANRAIRGFNQELASARVDRLRRMLQHTEEALLRHAEEFCG